MSFTFDVIERCGEARLGRITTAHGVIETPAFMPVGTLGAVRGIAPQQLEALGASIMLANLFHLQERVGSRRIRELGGIHEFCGWTRPILTDSGGYQVFSLADLRRVDDDGVSFRSPHDGDLVRLTPESVVQAQGEMGVDFGMVLDECPPWPIEREEAASSLRRTQRWAERSREAMAGLDGSTSIFGIVQGSFYEELRERAVEQLVPLDFPGYAIGGVSVGEGTKLGRTVVEQTAPSLPADRPRYLMGLGYPEDLEHAVRCGVDLFDCVLPSRNARHGTIFTRDGILRIKNAKFRDDPRPLDESCSCPTCARLSRAFLHHLFRSGEVTSKVLATVHNVSYFLDFMHDLREALRSGKLSERHSFEGGDERR